MQPNPIGWVEIPVTDLDRAEAFYQDYFGFKLDRQPEKNGWTMSWFPMDQSGYGSGATLMKCENSKPSSQGILIYFTAPEPTIEESLKKAESMGIEILTPKTDIGEHGFFAIIKDTEGNQLGIHSMKG